MFINKGGIFSGKENKITIDNTAALKVDSIRKAHRADSIEKALANAGVTLKQYADLTAKQQRAYDSLMANCNKPVQRRVVKYTPKFYPAKVQPPQKVIIEIQDKRSPQAVVQFTAPAAPPVTIKVNTAPDVDATYLKTGTGFVGATVVLEDKLYKYCLRVSTKTGYAWEPYNAVMNRGIKFSELTDNGVGGFDLSLKPSGTLATIVPTGPFLTTDGYCGVPESSKFVTSDELKTNAAFIDINGRWIDWTYKSVNGVPCRIAEYASRILQ